MSEKEKMATMFRNLRRLATGENESLFGLHQKVTYNLFLALCDVFT